MGSTVAQRMRLAAVEDELATLRAQYELALSTFKFDEANALQRQIEPLEAQRQTLTLALPPTEVASEPPVGVIRPIKRPARRRRTRRLR